MDNRNDNIILTERAGEEFKHHSLLKLLNRNRFVSNQEISRGHLLDEQVLSSHIINCHLKNLSLINSTFTNCNFNDVTFEFSELKCLRFLNCSFTSVRFINNLIDNLSFENCYFEQCELDFKAPNIKTSNVYFYSEKNLKVQQNDKKEIVTTKPLVPKDHLVTPVVKAAPLEPMGRFGHLDLEEK